MSENREEANMDEEEEIEISDALEKVALYAFDEARQKLDETGEFEPFTVMLEGDNLYFESHPGEDVDECFESARRTILSAQDAIESYVFCYDGFVDLDDGTHDAIIVEAAESADPTAKALCLIYDGEGEAFNFDEQPAYLDEVPTFFDLTLVGTAAIPERDLRDDEFDDEDTDEEGDKPLAEDPIDL